ncbi:MAG: YraN family protein [Brevibacterium yomogidense]|uniref:YraN family protein n=1 Tax=Brevibacterium sp. Mu109 TaxID=1255669 RepID=UPI000C3957E6|nr:YraN family protein [Brevibacterium sp. Mu109]SMX70304.1 putative endonuclease [Brevibacterium sp. Mu109]
MSRQTLGRRGEDFAVQHLEARGWTIHQRNWRCRHGEIDIIAITPDGTTVVFVEVRTRSSVNAGHPLETIGVRKAARMRRTAGAWLSAQDEFVPRFRIDVIGLIWAGTQPELTHLEGLE